MSRQEEAAPWLPVVMPPGTVCGCAAGGRPGWVSSRSVHHQEHSRSSLSLSELQFIYTHRATEGGGRQGSHFWVGEAGALGEVSQWLHGS